MHKNCINSQSRKQREHQLIFKNADITACWGCWYTSGPEALAEFILDPGFTQFLCILNFCTLSVIFKTSINFDDLFFIIISKA